MVTKVVKISKNITAEDENALFDAACRIKNGDLVVFPTETVYGLGGNGLDASAAEKIYLAKGRPSDNPLILHIAKPSDAEDVAYTSPLYYRLAEEFMPGPLTVIMPVKESVPKTVTAGLATVAVRCPADPVANAFIKAAGVPIAAPSANISGSPSPTCFSHVYEDMNGRVSVIIDGGDAEFGLESTIVKIEDDATLLLLRPGAVTPDELSRIAPLRIAESVLSALKEGETVLSPGMKYKHYAPKTETVLLDGDCKAVSDYIKKENKRVAVLCYDEDEIFFRKDIPSATVIPFGKRSDTKTQAHKLFYLLRETDKLSVDVIYAPLPEPKGVGMALYNRMIRAAAHKIVTLKGR